MFKNWKTSGSAIFTLVTAVLHFLFPNRVTPEVVEAVTTAAVVVVGAAAKDHDKQ